MRSPKTILKIGVAIAIPMAIVFVALPQFRAGIVNLTPFALLALCPLGMLFGMRGMMGRKDGDHCPDCNHQHSKKTR